MAMMKHLSMCSDELLEAASLIPHGSIAETIALVESALTGLRDAQRTMREWAEDDPAPIILAYLQF